MNIWQTLKEMWAFLMSPSDFSTLEDAKNLFKNTWYIWGGNQWSHYAFGVSLAGLFHFALKSLFHSITLDENVFFSVFLSWLVSVFKEIGDYRKQPTPDIRVDSKADNLCWLLGAGFAGALLSDNWELAVCSLLFMVLAGLVGSIDRISQANKAS
jgi:hypothetical protein